MARLAYGLEEAAEQASVSVKTLQREIRDGNLRARRVRGRVRGRVVILHAELERWLGTREPVPSQAETRRQSRRGQTRVTRLFDINAPIGPDDERRAAP